MKLKNILIGALGAIATFAATACSNIADDERLIYVKPAEVGRTILIEDFTGQRCVNCPRGTEAINAIIEAYGEDNVVAVGIHSGPLGFAGNNRVKGLMTNIGNEYYKRWDSENKLGQPWALFNRSAAPSSDYNTWAAYVARIISKTAPVKLALNNAYDADKRTISIDVDADGVDGNTEGYLQVWLIEDGVVALQLMPDGSSNSEYVHNHVFRDAVNGTWGESIAVNEGTKVSKHYTYTIADDKDWVPENMAVVAFVYNNSEVLQTTKKPIIAAAE